jgi:hypothetical protein
MSNVRFGYMGTSLKRTIEDLEAKNFQPYFAEFQVHDELLSNIGPLCNIVQPSRYRGHFTIHGEGETDGKKKIKFSSTDRRERERYINECIGLYSFVLTRLSPHRILRVILHPDTLSKRVSRSEQLSLLAMSLTEVAEKLNGIDGICIEPRGGERQNKVLRADLDDIKILQGFLDANSIGNIGLCIDVAQLFVVYGNEGTAQFLKDLSLINMPVKEFHISDVLQNTNIKNRVAMEVGTGSIDWKLILPLTLQHCNDLLIETLGGVKVFIRSKKFLDSLLNGR